MKKWWQSRRTPSRVLPRGTTGSLREFVYLDDIAVTSLVSSLLGSVTEGSTESVSEELLAEIASTHEARIPGFYGGSLSGRLSGSSSSGRSIQRKANIQATFEELERELRPRYRIRSQSMDPVAAVTDPERLLQRAVENRAAIKVNELERGTPFELEVELDLHESYSLLALVETFNSFAREPDLIGRKAVEAYRPAQSVGRLLRMMMGGLVPLVCDLTDMQLIDVAGESWLVHRNVAGVINGATASPVQLVAICEESLFWKDIRRVAFERGRYRITGRVARSGIQSRWTAIKMSDVIRRFSPDVATQLDQMPHVMTQALHTSMASAQPSSAPPIRASLAAFGASLAAAHDRELGTTLAAELAALPDSEQTYDSPDDWRPLFSEAAQVLSRAWEVEFTPEQLLDARSIMLSTDPGADQDAGIDVLTGEGDSMYLEADVIAVHW